MKKQILGTGLSGLVGTRIVELLANEFEFADLSYDTGVDITSRDQVFSKVQTSQAEWILHLAAKADVDGCETDKPLGKNGLAWKINVGGTENIVAAAQKYSKRVLYISTDFVFAGKKDLYSETDTPQPLNWYGQTKFEGEKLVVQYGQNIVARIAYPYRAVCKIKKDFIHTILDKLKLGAGIMVLKDHIFTPTLIDDIALAIKRLIVKNASGIFHVVGSTSLTPFAAAQLIAKEFGYAEALITPTSIANYYGGRAKRPYKLRLKNDKIVSLGVPMGTFLDGLKKIKQQGVI